MLIQIEAADRYLLSAISDAMAEAARRSGDWLVCRPGCTECCFGPFAITALDAIRLQRGLAQLEQTDPERSRAVRMRAADYIRAISSLYPGDPATGELFDKDALPEAMDDLACPALDPATGCCDLYSSRPITCRTFGPVTHVEGEALGACELCYTGASEEQMAACAVEIDPENIEGNLLASLEAQGIRGETIVAYALVSGLPISQ
ncbi:MAG TPA: YkgJ family cysteine cluster protein [Bryobacteraceae bacterium]|nr:YkgJ family cysteine cluster protein [Bryobacteraceae bacterium]